MRQTICFDSKCDIFCRISSSERNSPDSWKVSQKSHFRLHPEKRMKIAAVPV